MQRRRKVTGNCKEEGGGGALKTKVFRENSYAKQEFLVGWEKGFHTNKQTKKKPSLGRVWKVSGSILLTPLKILF